MEGSRVDQFMSDVEFWRNKGATNVEFIDDCTPVNNNNSNNDRVYSRGVGTFGNPKVIQPDDDYVQYASDGENSHERVYGRESPQSYDETTEKIDAVYDKICSVDQTIRNIVDGIATNTEIMSSQIAALTRDQETILQNQKEIIELLRNCSITRLQQ